MRPAGQMLNQDFAADARKSLQNTTGSYQDAIAPNSLEKKGFWHPMKLDALDGGTARKTADPVEPPVTEDGDEMRLERSTAGSAGNVEAADVDRLLARINELEKERDERDALRRQAEQALALTRRQFTRVLQESAPLRRAAGAAAANPDVAVLESALRQRQEENSQAWSELSSVLSRAKELEQQLEKEASVRARLEEQLAEANSWTYRLAGDRREAERARSKAEQALEDERHARATAEGEVGALQSALELIKKNLVATEADRKLAEERRDEAYKEIAAISRFLQASESIAAEQEDRLAWFARVTNVLQSDGPWWSRLLPPTWTRKLRLRRLAAERLFDSTGYLRRYPDVRASGQDPLRHYINHGMAEGRHA